MSVLQESLLLTSSEAAEMLDTHPSSIKRWSSQGELPCVTTKGGHRRFTLDALRDFATQTGAACPFGVLGEDLEPFVQALRNDNEELDEVLFRLLFRWLLDSDVDKIEWTLAYLRTKRYTLGTLFDRLVVRMLVEVGLAWQRGEIMVAQEHFMSHQVYEALYRLRPPSVGRAKHRPIAVVAGSEGSQHVFGVMVARIILEHLGWRVLYLGGAVPNEDLVEFVLEQRPQLVCIGFSQPQVIVDVRRTVAVLQRAAAVHPFALALGGQPATNYVPPAGFSVATSFTSLATFEKWALQEGLRLSLR
jgi:MerR family transcriptional regulator, light-induced transcriptional regulator